MLRRSTRNARTGHQLIARRRRLVTRGDGRSRCPSFSLGIRTHGAPFLADALLERRFRPVRCVRSDRRRDIVLFRCALLIPTPLFTQIAIRCARNLPSSKRLRQLVDVARLERRNTRRRRFVRLRRDRQPLLRPYAGHSLPLGSATCPYARQAHRSLLRVAPRQTVALDLQRHERLRDAERLRNVAQRGAGGAHLPESVLRAPHDPTPAPSLAASDHALHAALLQTSTDVAYPAMAGAAQLRNRVRFQAQPQPE